MKRILCRLAQRRLDPTGSQAGWIASHLDSCADCRSHLDQVRTLELQLHSPPPKSDEALCDAIMSKVRNAPQPVPAPTRAADLRPWILGASGLAAAAALVIAVISLTKPDPADHSQADTPPVIPERVPVVAPEVPRNQPPESPAQALAHVMHQQELLQRDARKLGAHLRERVILFRPVD